MRKIDKSIQLSTKYQNWLNGLDKPHPKSSSYTDDVVMSLYSCQKGVCAYTEMFICPPVLYANECWTDGGYNFPEASGLKRNHHLGELEHFDPDDKKERHWNWDNLFMIDAKINSNKSNQPVAAYLKPDLDDYSPERYFDYDRKTHRFVPNSDIEDEDIVNEIQRMIDEVLYLNHGVIRIDRTNFIKTIKDEIDRGIRTNIDNIDRFFTATQWVINGKP